jgi:hypothetical protein
MTDSTTDTMSESSTSLLPPMTSDTIRAVAISARRAYDYAAEAAQERLNIRAAEMDRIDQEWRESGFEDHLCSGEELTWPYARRRARNCESCA